MNFRRLFFILLWFSFLLLSLSIINPAFSQTCTDGDGDGYGVNGDPSCTGIGVDCDDNDDTVYPGAPKLCDGKDNNCDDKKDFTTDEDKDNDGEPWCAGDCDDNNPNRSTLFLEAPEGSPICTDGIDNDCDNKTDSVDPGCQFPCFDMDGDGYGLNGDPSCPFPGEIDCNDNDDTINPGETDNTCNGIDNNCSGTEDDEYVIDSTCGVGECETNNTASSCVAGVETLCIPGIPAQEGVVGSPSCTDGKDNDCDGLSDTDPACLVSCQDFDEDGYGTTVDVSCQFAGIDCDDSNALINPGGDDANCNAIDEDCADGADSGYIVDFLCGEGECQTNNTPSSCTGGVETLCQPGLPVTEGPAGGPLCTDGLDNDCDGLTDTADSEGCSSLDVDDDGDGITENQGDCNDGDATMYPGAPKLCDAKDNNCDGKKDFTTDEDKDNDGVTWCVHWETGLQDCDDNNANRAPNITEAPIGSPICNDLIDNDCDNLTDAADPGCQFPCLDTDGDTYGANGDPSCVGTGIDCDDSDATINPGEIDNTCNDTDNNCSGVKDDEYVIDDTCGTGECQVNNIPSSCTAGGVETLCAPGTPQPECPFPGDPSNTDGKDNNCNGQTDECPPGPCWDVDGDGYGINGNASCPVPGELDCDDTDPAVHPGGDDANCNGKDEDCVGGADSGYVVDSLCGEGECQTSNTPSSCAGGVETLCQPGLPVTEGPAGGPLCTDGLDNDCDGLIDQVTGIEDSDCSSVHLDDDGDGYCEEAPCEDGSSPGDCNDGDITMYPGAPKLCDAKDNNCDGKRDFTTDQDQDEDGVTWCQHWDTGLQDCDDTDPLISPLIIEAPKDSQICTDGIDNNCNGLADEIPGIEEPGCVGNCLDLDGDGYGQLGDVDCPFPGLIDCDDTDPTVNPGQTDDSCNDKDNNCSGVKDDEYVIDDTCGTGECLTNNIPSSCAAGGVEILCQPGTPQPECPAPGDPSNTDGKDNNCNGQTDECPSGPCWDVDGDGYGVLGDPLCPVPGVIDCDDTDATVNPGQTDDSCNDIDNNCSGVKDDEYVIDDTCGTGECQTNNIPSSCAPGGVETPCQEGLPVPEDTPFVGVCIDGLDNDCDGLTDLQAGFEDPDCSNDTEDNDGDGFCRAASCTDGSIPNDCDDTDPNVYPGAPKVCDGKDNNCDFKQDFATDKDVDEDGVPLCVHFQTGLSDCDDNDPLAFPGNTPEGPFGDPTCSDIRDNDCVDGADAADTKCQAPSCDTKTDPKDGLHLETMMAPGPDGLPNTGDDVVHPENSNLLCGKCHGATLQDPIRSDCDRCHTPGGTSKAAYPDPWPFGFGSSPDVQMHSSTVLGIKYGAWDMDCVNCHNPHLQEQNAKFGTTYGKYIKEYICYDNTAIGGGNFEEFVEFSTASGPGSFADGAPYNENICEMCHTLTSHHRRDGLAPGDWDGVPGSSTYLGHNDGNPCTDCHFHADGFKPGAAGQSHDTHLNSIKGPSLDCETGCHGTNSPPLFADGNDLANTTVCDNCHSPGGVFDGVNDPVTGAKTNWTDSIYDGRTLAVGKEMWCAGCHDDAPSNSMLDGTGVSAGNITGDNTTVGFYITGHGNDPGVNCIQCHDASKKHIDHLFAPAEDVVRVLGNPTNYRFYDGKGMSLPHTLNPVPVVDDFRLCFTCHDETWFDSLNMTTNFRVQDPPFSGWLDSNNLHYFHLFSYGNQSVTNCVLCHDPHGTDRPMMTDVTFTGKFSALTLDAGSGKYIGLTDPADWHNPALNAGGVITQNGACFTCHFSVPSEPTLAAGLGPAEGVEDGWYLRSYNVPAYSVNFDVDGDGLSDAEDNCSGVTNDQTDSDGDGIGDDCDNCVNDPNTIQVDTDNDGIGNACDPSCDTSVLEWRFQFGADTDVGGILSDQASALTLDNNGNIYVAGQAAGNFNGSSTPDYSNGADVFLRKYDPAGNALWTEKAASALNDDIASDVALDSNGNIYVTGYTKGSFPNNTNQAEGVTYDLFVVKFAPDKTISWIKELGTAQDDKAYAMAISSNDDIYVAGTTNGDLCGTLNGTSDYFLMKFDASGTSVCVDQFGSTVADDAKDVEVDSAGNLYVVFGTYGTLPGFTNLGDYDSFVIKYDQAGSRQQTLQIATAGSDQANGVDVGTDDSIYVAGTTTGSLTAQQNPGSNEIFLIKYDTGGTPQWTSQRSGQVLSVKRVAVDPVGNSYITGIINAPLDGMVFQGSVDIYLVKFEAAGNSAWAKSWGGLSSDHAFDIALDNIGNHYITGLTEYEFPPNANLGSYDAILLKGSEVCP